MSARIGVWQAKWSRDWWWQCDDPDDPMPGCPAKRSYGIEFSLAAAADAGREHMRRFHYDKEAVVFAALDEYAADHPERFVSCTQPEHECCVAHTCCVCATPRTERSHADA